jgi:tight adherence protein B
MHEKQLPLMVSVLSAVAVFTIIYGLYREWRRRHDRVADRLRQLEQQRRGLLAEAITQQETGQVVAALNQIAGKVGLAQQLSYAGIPLTAGEYILIVGILLAIGLVLSVVLHNYFLCVVLLAGAWWGPRWWIARQRAKRIRDFEKQLSGTIQLLANALRAGSSNVPMALEMAAQQTQPPMSKELAHVIRDIKDYGISQKEALINLTVRIQSVDLQLLVTAINLQHESGGNLVQMLERIGETIRERVRLNGDIKALTSQQIYSGYVVAMLPVAIMGILMLTRPSYVLGVFQTTHWCGWTMYSLAGVMIVTGILVIRRVVDVKV